MPNSFHGTCIPHLVFFWHSKFCSGVGGFLVASVTEIDYYGMLTNSVGFIEAKIFVSKSQLVQQQCEFASKIISYRIVIIET